MIKTVYTIFLGLLLAVFVGVTVSTFYPAPKAPDYPKVLSEPATSTTDTAEMQQARANFDKQQDDFQKAESTYNRNVFAIVLACAIVMLIISLTFMKQIPIIADGVLLGGTITLLYAIVRSLMSDEGMVRFFAVTIGLIVALILGYIKFIHPDKKAAK
jgi:hypothetical protein